MARSNPDYYVVDPRIKKIRKPIYAPNATHMGYSKYEVQDGDLILYDEYEKTRLARVLGRATHDGAGKEYKTPVLLVLAANDMVSFGMERHVPIEAVHEIRRPSEHEWSGDFAEYFFTGDVSKPAEVLRTVQYGAMSDSYIAEYLKDGKLQFDKVRGITKAKRTKKNPKKKNPKKVKGVRGLVSRALK